MNTVSIIIPTFNHAKFLPETIESVLAQTRKADEIIIVDDGSTDDTSAVVERYEREVTYYYKANGGTSTALNTGIRRAKGEWICWLSADDLFMPTKLEKQFAFAERYPRFGLIYSDFYIVSEDSSKILRTIRRTHYTDRETWTRTLLQTGCLINGSTTMIRKSVFYKAGLFVPELLHSQDYNMWIRLSRICDFGYIAEPLVKYRFHPGNDDHRADPNRFRELARKKAF